MSYISWLAIWAKQTATMTASYSGKSLLCPLRFCVWTNVLIHVTIIMRRHDDKQQNNTRCIRKLILTNKKNVYF
jgi:hypothetical protein